MFRYPDLDVTIERDVDTASLSWPAPGEAGADGGLGCNRQYEDLRGHSWAEARRVFDLEHELIARIENAENSEDAYEALQDELYESDEDLYGLDIGVASIVVALSAARCVPFSSCNGGVFGGHHYETHPLVAFFARPWMVPLLLSLATEADIGLVNRPEGCLVAYAGEIRKLRSFAANVINHRTSIHASGPKKRRHNPQPLRRHNPKPHTAGEQLSLMPEEERTSAN